MFHKVLDHVIRSPASIPPPGGGAGVLVGRLLRPGHGLVRGGGPAARPLDLAGQQTTGHPHSHAVLHAVMTGAMAWILPAIMLARGKQLLRATD
ncbi:hypothetical protein NKH18_42585 [Streptomyces sp. M10(2022)]